MNRITEIIARVRLRRRLLKIAKIIRAQQLALEKLGLSEAALQAFKLWSQLAELIDGLD
jgi:hypothetical protein